MKDTKIVFALVGMVEALCRDNKLGRSIASDVTAELLCMTDDKISDVPERAAYQAKEYVQYAYGGGEPPSWYTESHMSSEW